MRVIAGEARGRRIEAPPGNRTRPITDRAKESIFNMLVSLLGTDGLAGATVVDLYAGSGSFGIESLSRGAGHVVFVERDQAAAATIERNLDALGLTDRASVRIGGAETMLASLPEAVVAFCDPPYALDPWPEVFDELRAEVVVGHAEHDIELTPGWTELRRRTYGRSRIVIAERGGGG